MNEPYLLVLQFQGDELSDLSAIVSLEDQLSDRLPSDAHVDGHDIGSGETNIFIHTRNVAESFEVVKLVLERAGVLEATVVASRPIESGSYAVIWPRSFSRQFRVA